jgi:hypothetical protein
MPGARFDVSSFRNSIAERACLRNSIAPGVRVDSENNSPIWAKELPGQVRAKMEFWHEEAGKIKAPERESDVAKMEKSAPRVMMSR